MPEGNLIFFGKHTAHINRGVATCAIPSKQSTQRPISISQHTERFSRMPLNSLKQQLEKLLYLGKNLLEKSVFTKKILVEKISLENLLVGKIFYCNNFGCNKILTASFG